ncbi:DUF6660 family protein [Rufibacter sediminis]|uniref:DUF6660 family protein n=1 Tax=Rufibacter TaxID=1379908 RepID=UPI0034E2ECE7
MKWFNLILAVFMTFMACMPCSDVYGYAETTPGTSVTPSPVTENHQEARDMCTPLCICSCCAGFSQPTSASLQIEAKAFFNRTPLLAFYRERHLAVHASIWQPPKV